MIPKGDPHKHDYQKLVLIPCLSRDKPMGILARVCACGAKQAFDYGERNVMRELGIRYAKEQKARHIPAGQNPVAETGTGSSQGTVGA